MILIIQFNHHMQPLYLLACFVTSQPLNDVISLPGHCQVGWSLILSCIGIVCVFILAIVSCVLAGQTDTRKNIHNPIVDVRPAAYPGQVPKGFMQSSA